MRKCFFVYQKRSGERGRYDLSEPELDKMNEVDKLEKRRKNRERQRVYRAKERG